MLKHNYKVKRFLSKHFIPRIWKFDSLNFHTKTVSALAVAIGMSFTGIAAEIQVPALWTSDKPVKEHQVEQVGFYKDSDKYVFAVKINGFGQVAKLPQAAISIYLEVDGKKETGRIVTGGTDLQMNISISKGKIKLINWENNKESYITLSEDDYLLQMTGDVYYIALRKELLKQIVFSGKILGVKFVVSADSGRISNFDNRYEIGKSTKTITPLFYFNGFNSKSGQLEQVD